MAKHNLTRREAEVARLLSLGCTVKEAAAALCLAPSTIDNHAQRLRCKLGVSKAATLTRRCLELRITTLKDELTATEKRRIRRRVR